MSSLFNEIHFNEIDSTSAYLKREHNNLNSYTIVSASFQTNGKGRLDRSWISNKDTNLLFSLLLKEDGLINAFPYLSIGVAYSISKTLINLGLKNVKVKWPNDVYVNDKKICGILLEGSLPNYLIIGVGLNVNQNSFIENLRHPATSIKLELNKELILEEVKNEIFKAVTLETTKILNKDLSFLNEIDSLDYLKNKIVKVDINNQIKEVEVLGINQDCSLSIKDENQILSIKSGEISFL